MVLEDELMVRDVRSSVLEDELKVREVVSSGLGGELYYLQRQIIFCSEFEFGVWVCSKVRCSV